MGYNNNIFKQDLLTGIGKVPTTETLEVGGNLQLDGLLKSDGAGDNYFLGNLGIGTDSPSVGIHLSGTGLPATMSITDTAITNSSYNTLRFFAATQNKFSIGVGTTVSYSSHITIDGTNGNVGIGTTTPSEKLEVSGNGLFSGTLTASNLSGINTGDQVIPDNTDFVPYVGATTNVNLGTYDLNATDVIASSVWANSYMKITDNSTYYHLNSSTSLNSNTDEFTISKTESGISKILNFDFSSMPYPSETTLTIPISSGTLALTSDISGFGIGAGLFISNTITAPTSNTDTGVKGEVRIVGTDRYECIATNIWVKSTVITTF